MELLFLILLVPVIWLVMLPARLAGAAKRHRFTGFGIIAALAVVGYFTMQILAAQPEPRADYTHGDAALRAMLE
jgi:D-alanyl-lipoteichoic acid acyltransferase DltB (MBOAT superfamily)